MGEAAVAAEPRRDTPTAGQVRTRLRGFRRAHHTGSWGDALTDAYLVVLLVLVYGSGLLYLLQDHLRSPETVAAANARWWAGLAAAVAGAGLAWRGLRTLGPLLVTPATMAWAASSPVDRRAWLLPRFRWLTAGAAAVVGALGLGVAALGGTGRPAYLIAAGVAGAACGAGGVALGVLAQSAWRDPPWARWLGRVLLAVGAAIALMLGLVELTGAHPPAAVPAPPLVAALALAATPAAAAATVRAGRALARLDRASLTTGAQLAGAAVTAAMALDPTLLTTLLEVRRWRAVGRVRSRRLRGRGRFWILVQAELRRPARRPGVVVTWVVLALAVYAVAAALPPLAGPAHVILGYLVANQWAGGLRAVCRSPGLRRALGGRDAVLYGAHLVVPTLSLLAWYLLTLPAVRPQVTWLDLAFLAVLVRATHRTASRPPMSYGGTAVETPFGLLPVDLITQVVRGPDLVAILVLVQFFPGLS